MRVGIVGGGMLGLTVAWDLIRSGHDVTIYEAAATCGGLAAPWQLGSVTWDRHYHVTLFSDVALRALLDEIGVTDLRFVAAQTGFYASGRMHPFTTAIDFLRFPPLGPIDKLRLGATIAYASRLRDWQQLERLTAVEWLTKLSGARTVERIWLPLLRAKLGLFAERASAAFIWAIIARMYAARRAGLKRELFGYVRGGYASVIEAFVGRLLKRGVTIRTSTPVASVERSEDGLLLRTSDATEYYDAVLVTLASPLVPRICPGLSDDERTLFSGIEYQGIVCASMLLDEPLTPYYITNIADASIPFTAIIEMTAIVDRHENTGGYHLVYLPKYTEMGDRLFRAPDAEIEALFLSAVARIHPTFTPARMRAFRISRIPYVFPVPTIGYSQHLPPIETSVPGLFAANSTHIVNGTLNVNETVMLAHRVAHLVSHRSPVPVGVAR